MTTRAVGDLPGIYRGDDWDWLLGCHEAGGGTAGNVEAGQGVTLTDGSDQITLPTGVNIRLAGRPDRGFNAGDVDRQVTLYTGDGIPDGTTITDVAIDGRTATMSTNATADRTGDAVILVRARDLTAFTATSQVRVSEDGAILFAVPIVDDRFAYGIVHATIPSKTRAVFLGQTPVTSLSYPLPGGQVLVTDVINSGGIYDLQLVDTDGFTSTPLLGKIAVVKDRTHT